MCIENSRSYPCKYVDCEVLSILHILRKITITAIIVVNGIDVQKLALKRYTKNTSQRIPWHYLLRYLHLYQISTILRLNLIAQRSASRYINSSIGSLQRSSRSARCLKKKTTLHGIRNIRIRIRGMKSLTLLSRGINIRRSFRY